MKLLVTLHGTLGVLATPEQIREAIVAKLAADDALVEVQEGDPDSTVVTLEYLDSLSIPY